MQALSSVVAEVNMLRANSSSEQSSIATEDALRYLRAAKYNSTKAIEIYKNYQVCPIHWCGKFTQFVFGIYNVTNTEKYKLLSEIIPVATDSIPGSKYCPDISP